MPNPQIITEPLFKPVTAVQVREQFRYLESAEDGLITAYIDAAIGYLQPWLKRSFAQRTLKLYFDGPPRSVEFELPYPPLIAVVEMKYKDVDGAEQTLVEGTAFQVDAVREPGRIRLEPDQSWPTTEAGRLNAFYTIYTSGFVDADAIPQIYKQLIRWVVALWFRNREGAAPVNLMPVPHSVEEFVNQYKIHRIG